MFKEYKASKAISVLLTEGSLTTTDGRQASAALQRLGASAIPKIIEALAVDNDTLVLETLLVEFISNETLPIFTDALTKRQPKLVRAIVKLLSKSKQYDPNKLLSLFDKSDIPLKAISAILTARVEQLHSKNLIRAVDGVANNARPVIYKLLDAKKIDDIPLIVAKTQHKEPLVRAYFVSLLSKLDCKLSRHTLTQLLGDPNKVVRQSALIGLAELKSEDSVELICQCLSDPDMTVQTTAIETLCKINAPDTIKLLIDVLQDESEYVRRAAVEVLNEIGDQRAIKDLLEALRDADWWVKVRAADALGTIGGPKVFEAVILLIKDKDEFMRRTAVEILNSSKDPKAFNNLVDALQDEDWWVRERAADALAGLADQRAVEPLLAMLDRSPEASQVVLRALTTIGDSTAIKPIVKLLNTKDKNLQRDALLALKQITDEAHAGDVQQAITQLIDDSSRNEIAILAEETVQALRNKFDQRALPYQSSNTSSVAELMPLLETQIEQAPTSSSDLNHADSSAKISLLDAARLKPGDMYANRYKVIRHIGKGAFGIVVLVEDIVVHDQYILKILNPHVASDEYNIKRFTQELRYARKVTHQNVIRIYDFIKHESSYAISMEYFPSHSLRWKINQNSYIEHQIAVNIFLEICEGMIAAEKADVIHRDLKPGNILINDDEFVKIVDFGLAAAASRVDSRITKTGLLVGTPTYMAPEQVRGKKVDSRTDIYSLGIIMYEVFTGEVPYAGDDSMSVMFQHVEGNFTAPRKLNPGISPELEAIIVKCMNIEPEGRFSSFRELKSNIALLNREIA
ncbi:MAG: HEAT repeat domain-containing protein [Thiohalomonadales bacterium]